MKTFYVTFGVSSVLRNVILCVQADSRDVVIDTMKRKEGCAYFCDAYQWDEKTAVAKASIWHATIVDGGIIE